MLALLLVSLVVAVIGNAAGFETDLETLMSWIDLIFWL